MPTSVTALAPAVKDDRPPVHTSAPLSLAPPPTPPALAGLPRFVRRVYAGLLRLGECQRRHLHQFLASWRSASDESCHTTARALRILRAHGLVVRTAWGRYAVVAPLAHQQAPQGVAA